MQDQATAGLMQKVQRSVSARSSPLLSLIGVTPGTPQAPHTDQELVPLKAVMQQQPQLEAVSPSGQSLERRAHSGTSGIDVSS